MNSGARVLLVSIAIVALLCTIDACNRETPDPLPQIEPFATLQAVHLGMSSHELLKVRPRLSPEPYVGYSESLANFKVTYAFDDLYSEEQRPSSSSAVIRISADRSVASDSAATEIWRDKLRSISTILNATPRCSAVGGQYHSNLAVWPYRRGSVILGVFPPPDAHPRQGPNGVGRFYVLVDRDPRGPSWLHVGDRASASESVAC